jgi:F-type H+-transporting ATPase subunit b
MDVILQALGGILLRALPTFILVILLHFYLKYVFFGPLNRVLKKRYELTEGARAAAEESLQRAGAKVQEYEAALRSARAEIYQHQEQAHRKLQHERDSAVQASRADAEAAVARARAELAADVEQARESLIRDSEGLAERIADSILQRRVA